MIYIIKQEGLYQNKVNSSLVFTSNFKMGYSKSTKHDVSIYHLSHKRLYAYEQYRG